MTTPAVRPSPTLATNERIRELRAAGRPVVHLAFGEAGLPVHPALREILDAASLRNSYPPVAGNLAARSAAAGYFVRRRLATDAGSIVFAPGSKPLLFALLMALEGDLLLPQPSWVSYAAQAQIAAKSVVRIPIPESAGGVPDPDALEEWAKTNRGRRAIVLVTLPDNPTGTLPGSDVLHRVCEVAQDNEWWIVSDEIYRDLTYEPERFLSPAEFYPERTVVTTGLSKNLALGGWRIGFARFPANHQGRELIAAVGGIASEVWSAMAAPMQEVAAFSLNEPRELVEHVDAARRLHRSVTTALHRVFVDRGAAARAPQGAFYFYPEFGVVAPGITTSEDLAHELLERHDVAVLPGNAFGDDPSRLTVRVAASLLYGSNDDERWAALQSDEPAKLPWIAHALEHVDHALGELVR